jgi:hypothetical protein
MAVNLWLPFTPTFVDSNGVPLTGAKLFFYAAGSSTKLSTYTTSSGAVPNANPMILDAGGRPTQAIWLTGGLLYKIGLAASTESDPPSAFLWPPIDNVSGINDATSSASEWIASGSTPTYVSATSFTVPGDQTSTFTVGRRLQIVDAGGTTWSTIKTSAFAAATTVTLIIDSGASLTAPLSSVSFGIANPAHYSIPKNDNAPVAYNNADPSKIVILSASGLTTATTRTLTAQDKDLTIAGLGDILNAPVRQTVLNGAVDSSGYANHLSAGAGLNTNISATATPLVITYAQGFGATGATNKVSVVSADASNQGSLAANSTNFITSTYSTDTAVTWGSTLAPPQYGIAYDRTKQSVLQFGGSAGSTTFLDDYGNTWSAQGGAKVQTNQFKFGTGGLGGGGASNILNGTTDYIKSTSFTTLGGGGWSIRGWVYTTALPTAGNTELCATYTNGSGAGVQLGINNVAGTIRFTYSLSSNGSTNDIAAAAVGTSTPTTNTWFFVEITYDNLAGIYRLYVGGTQEQSTTSASKICGITQATWGAGSAGANQWTGYIDKPEFIPYCSHPVGTTYTVPSAAPSITAAGYSSDWFDISGYKMYGPTVASSSAGTNPTLTAKNLVYHGEQDTSGAAVTATRNYAYQGKYESALTTQGGFSTKTSVNHNIGVKPKIASVVLQFQTAEAGYLPGDETSAFHSEDAAGGTFPVLATPGADALTMWTTNASTSIRVANKTTGATSSRTTGASKYIFRANRGF